MAAPIVPPVVAPPTPTPAPAAAPAATPPAPTVDIAQLIETQRDLADAVSMMADRIDSIVVDRGPIARPNTNAERNAALQTLANDRPELAPLLNEWSRLSTNLEQTNQRLDAAETARHTGILVAEREELLREFDVPKKDLDRAFDWMGDEANIRAGSQILRLREVVSRLYGDAYLTQHRRPAAPAPTPGAPPPPGSAVPAARVASIVDVTAPGTGPGTGPPIQHRDLREAANYVTQQFGHTLIKR